MEMTLNPKIRMGDLQPLKMQSFSSDAIKIATHADGGFVTRPTISWLAEGGYPESVIPIDGSRNALNLWQKTGEMLGAFGGKSRIRELKENLMESYVSGGSTLNSVDNSEESRSIVLNPVFNIHAGGGNTEEIEKTIRGMFGELKEMMEGVIKETAGNKERFNFY